MSNAFKFTPTGGQIKVQLKEYSNRLLLSVQDTGRGIRPEDLPNIFNRFYTTNRLDAPAEGGTGIGLSICKEFIKLMKGKIWVESELDKGKYFFCGATQKRSFGQF